MKKMMKRIGAVLLAVAMMGALAVSAWAVDNNKVPSANDKGTITVKNVDKNATSVTAYKIVKANYKENNGGFNGYQLMVADSIADIENPTAAELEALREQITNDNKLAGEAGIPLTKATTANGDGTYNWSRDDFKVGEYLILVKTSDPDYIYNLMVGSVYYVQADNVVSTGNEIDVTKEWNIKGDTVFVKSNKEDIEKTIVDNSRNNPNANSEEHGDDHAIGDTVSFKLKTTIPTYSVEYDPTKIIFNVLDSVSDGLNIDYSSIKVYVGADEASMLNDDGTYKTDALLNAANNTYTLTKTERDKRTGETEKTVKAFKIEFAKAYLSATANRTNNNNTPDDATDDYQEAYYVNGGKTVIVTYNATINSFATTNMDANENTATIEYFNNPDQMTDAVKKDDKTYHYTFEIDGLINGTETQEGYQQWTTHELIKVDEKGTVEETNKQKFREKTGETKVNHALAGAVFKLTRIKAQGEADDVLNGNDVYYAVTDANGYFKSFDFATNENNINWTADVNETAAQLAARKQAVINAITSNLSAANLKDAGVVNSNNEGDTSLIKGFVGLDAGTYELEEVLAPDGYSRDNTKIPVVITATYEEDDEDTLGMLKSYTITINGVEIARYSAKYDANTNTITEIDIGDQSPPSDPDMTQYWDAALACFIPNVKLAKLPSTGGIGTYIFTIAGVAIMAIAAGLLIVRKKKAD